MNCDILFVTSLIQKHSKVHFVNVYSLYTKTIEAISKKTTHLKFT
jgi:hypothetical protein